jgi:hypothetical protein
VKIHEILLETSEEDRAIISLSSSIYNYIQQYSHNTDKHITVGKIGDIFNTPLEILNSVQIILLSNNEIIDMIGEAGATGIWSGANDVIYLNKDYLTSNVMKSTVSHELRHALDDYKSNFKANKKDSRYVIPKNKNYRKSDLEYLAEPAEINARFLQVLHYMVSVIKRAANLSKEQQILIIDSSFKKALQFYRILELFPEKEKSRDYKRLIKRGIDFIQKELSYEQRNNNSS